MDDITDVDGSIEGQEGDIIIAEVAGEQVQADVEQTIVGLTVEISGVHGGVDTTVDVSGEQLRVWYTFSVNVCGIQLATGVVVTNTVVHIWVGDGVFVGGETDVTLEGTFWGSEIDGPLYDWMSYTLCPSSKMLLKLCKKRLKSRCPNVLNSSMAIHS